jgi:CheY-like chemotaxis protein
MPEGGVLTISTASLRAMQPLAVGEGQLPPGDYVLLTVADTGQGMSEEVRKRVFEPFFTTKEPGKGTGLGLPIVYGLMVQAGGFLTVTSDPGKGTVMRLHFPITSGIPEPLVGPQDGPSLKGTETILVAEDDSRVQKLVKAVLERLGYSVRMCSSGAEALAVASQPQESLDLLITDVIMPGLSGADLAREIKAIRPGLKILFMSGYTNDLISRHSVLDEGLSFLAKPFSPEVLGRKVREVLDAR